MCICEILVYLIPISIGLLVLLLAGALIYTIIEKVWAGTLKKKGLHDPSDEPCSSSCIYSTYRMTPAPEPWCAFYLCNLPKKEIRLWVTTNVKCKACALKLKKFRIPKE